MYTSTPHYDYAKFPDTTGLSPSSLNTFKECPYYYWAKRVAGLWVDEGKDCFDLGSGADSFITLSPEHYEAHYSVVARKTPKLKEEAEASKCPLDRCADDKCSGITLLSPGQDETIRGMVAELARQPLYSKFTGQGWVNQKHIEADIVDEFDGSSVRMRGKMDYFHEGAKIIADLKTCANLEKFKPSFYAMQMGIYHEVVRLSMGIDCQVFIIAVDKTDMTRSRIFLCSEATIEEGKKQAVRVIEQLKSCREANAWGNQSFDEEQVHACPTYSTCPYAIQKQIFTF